MILRKPLPLFLFLSAAAATLLTSTPTATRPCHQRDHTTPPPRWQRIDDLRKRSGSGSASSESATASDGGVSSIASSAAATGPFVCGYADGEVWTCNNHNAVCAATIMPNSKAYQYCSTPSAATQPVYTTFLENWNPKKACPDKAFCCESPNGVVVTDLFIASSYTVTAFECVDSTYAPVTWDPALTLLNPSKFSQSLAQLRPTSRSAGPSGTAANSQPTNSSSGLSSGAKAGIGAGVGVGLGILIIAGVAFFFWRRSQNQKGRVASNAASQEPYSYQTQYGQPQEMGYNQNQYQQPSSYYTPDASQWSQKSQYQQPNSHEIPPWSVQPHYAELDPQQATAAYPVEVPGSEVLPQELHGNVAKK